MNTLTIRPRLIMSKMAGIKKKKEAPIDDNTFHIRKLDLYRQYWEGMSDFRTDREKWAKYFNGDQWHEFIEDENGDTVTEEANIMNLGLPALKQNLIKSTVRSLLGQFRTDTSKSVVVARTPEKQKESEMLSNALQYVLASVNNAKEIDARLLEEYLISGFPIQEIVWNYIPELGKEDTEIVNVHPNSIAVNGDIEDIRGRDIRVIVRLMDLTVDQLLLKFGTTPEREAKLKEIYSTSFTQWVNILELNSDQYYSKDFYVPYDQGKCRVIEVWEMRLKERMHVHDWMNGTWKWYDWTQKDLDTANRFRINKYASTPTPEYPDGVPVEEIPLMEGEIEKVNAWYYTYYTPYGHILREGETPYDHGSHPYIIAPYPLLDGSIMGIVPDLIDSQRQLNRLLIFRDMILGSATRNVTAVDADSVDGKSPESIAKETKKLGGILIYDSKKKTLNPPMPLNNAASSNMGVDEGIQMYLKFMQDVSGVNPAMQGQQAPVGTSGKLYEAQISQSTLNSKDIMDSFSAFRVRRDMKLLQTIQQFWDTKRMIAVSGKSYTETAQLYDPEMVKDIKFDLTIGQTADSPVYRNIIEGALQNMLDRGFIDLEMFLEQTTLPFSNQLLESLKRRREQAQTDPQAAVQGLTQDVQNAGVQGNQQAVNQVYNKMKVG